MKFKINPDFKAEQFDDETLLYSIKNTKGIYLNSTARVVWELCANHTCSDEIITLLENTYPEQAKTIREEVDATIRSLIESNALIIEND